jgi:prepilin-type N-terminal cleavage/methylation domain-containing protein
MRTRGFTIVELIITITIMGILLTLAVVGVGTTQMNARDNERKADIEAIALHLESFYRGGSRDSSTIPTVTNYAANPSANGSSIASFGLAGSPVAATRTIASDRSHHGTTALKTVVSATGQIGAMAKTPSSTALRVDTTETLYWSLWLYSTKAGTVVPYADSTKVSDGTYTGCMGSSVAIPANIWTKVTASCIPVYDQYPNQIGVYNLSVVSGDTVWFDEFMVTKNSPSLPPYADGDSGGWTWNGSANSATSTGPVIPVGVTGVYPSISMLQSSLLTAYLQDADTKSFLPPGTSDPYSTFLSATNNTQTEAGVAPQPTTSQYIYQPIDSSGALCMSSDCRKYNLYYRLEKDNTVYMVTSKNQ